VIRLEGVTFAYAERRRVFSGLDLEIPPGVTLLLGPNGSGKSTMLKIIAGVDPPIDGRVWVGGHDLWREEAAARECLAYVPEHPDVTPLARIDEVVGLVCALRGLPRERAVEALETVGLARLRRFSVRDLSLGQRRRVLLAAALVGEPRVLLLDEPLETLDRRMQDLVIEWVGRRRKAGATIVIATHELRAFAPLADRCVGLDGGRLVEAEAVPDGIDERMERLDALARGVLKDPA